MPAVTITMRMPAPSDAYECALTASDVRFAEEISSQRGIMLAVTYAADPRLRRRPSPPVPRGTAHRPRAVRMGIPFRHMTYLRWYYLWSDWCTGRRAGFQFQVVSAQSGTDTSPLDLPPAVIAAPMSR